MLICPPYSSTDGTVPVTGIGADADGYYRIAFGTVDMGAYEVFVDCNTNDLADLADLMDANTNGAVDLEDYQHFQLCIDSTDAACVGLFDRALACGLVDLDDFIVFKDQLTGPPATTGGGQGQAKIVKSPKKHKDAAAWFAKVMSETPVIETADLAFEIQPMGGGAPLTTLAPHTTYELHYTADADGVSFYLMYAAAAGAAGGPDLIQPSVTGPWSDDHMFIVVDGGDEPPLAGNHPGLRWTDWVLDLNYLAPKAKGDAPSAAHACTITTGDAGELALDLYMFFQSNEPSQPMVVMQASATFAVRTP